MRLVFIGAVAITPWLISMYVLFWLDREQVWTVVTPYRDVASLAVLLLGMILSFVLLSRLLKLR